MLQNPPRSGFPVSHAPRVDQNGWLKSSPWQTAEQRIRELELGYLLLTIEEAAERLA